MVRKNLNKRKYIVGSILLCLLIIAFPLITKGWDYGVYNGTSNYSTGGGPGGECPASDFYCIYNMGPDGGYPRHETARISLIYYDGNQITHEASRIYTNNMHAISAIGISKGDIIERKFHWHSTAVHTAELFDPLKNTDPSDDWITYQYFNEITNGQITDYNSAEQYFFRYGPEVDIGVGYNHKGWRIIIEPLFTAKRSGKYYLVSSKLLAKVGTTNNERLFNSYPKACDVMLTKFDDIGITSPAGKGDSWRTRGNCADPTIGWGYNIINLDWKMPTCTTKAIDYKKTGDTNGYNKLMNDTAWALLNTSSTDACSCEDYIDASNTNSSTGLYGNDILELLEKSGKVDWSSEKCGGEKIDTCEEFKEANPNPSYAQMKAANKKWGNICYNCDNNTIFKAYDQTCQPSEDLCKFDIDLYVPNNCQVKTSGYMKDIKDWSCIFASTSDKVSQNSIKTHYKQEEKVSKYCDIYCREEVTYQYPDSNLVVSAGRRFTIGNTGYTPTLKPVTFKSKTECRTTSKMKYQIDINQFIVDWNSADTAVNTAWDEYQQAYANNLAANAATLKSTDSGTCSCEGEDCTPPSWSSKTYSKSDHVYGDYKGNASWTDYSGCKSGHTGSNKADTKTTSDSKLAIYEQKKVARAAVMTELHKCNSFQYTNRKFAPENKFKYEEEMYGVIKDESGKITGSKTYNLGKEGKILSSFTEYYTESSPKPDDYAAGVGSARSASYKQSWSDLSSYLTASTDLITTGTCSQASGSNAITCANTKGATATVKRYDCAPSKKCTHTSNQSYESNKWVQQTTEKEYNYFLPAGVYDYVSKPSGVSVNTRSDALQYSSQYYFLGFSNLPVHYSRLEGKYAYEFKFETLGEVATGHKFNKFVFGKEKTGITFGTNVDVYNYLWNTSWGSGPKLKDMISDCNQGGHHMNHSFVSAVGSTQMAAFKNTPCYTEFGCSESGGLVICKTYYDNSNNKKTVGPVTEYQTVYTQIRACINDKVVDTVGQEAFTCENSGTCTKYQCTYKVAQDLICDWNKQCCCKPGDTECRKAHPKQCPCTDGKCPPEEKQCITGDPDCPKKPVCEECPEGLNIVYRTISLNTPFPGVNGNATTGTTRSVGKNWSDIGAISDFITNNRGVKTNEVYKKEPMYRITLTPGLIKEIRSYNKTQKKVTPILNAYKDEKNIEGLTEGYSDYNLTCDLNGVNCTSKFIREKYKNYFSGCGISGGRVAGSTAPMVNLSKCDGTDEGW